MLMHRKQPSYKGNFIYSLTYAHLQWHFRMTLKKEYFFQAAKPVIPDALHSISCFSHAIVCFHCEPAS